MKRAIGPIALVAVFAVWLITVGVNVAQSAGYVVGSQVNGQIINYEQLKDDFIGDIDSDGDLEIVSWYTATASASAGSLRVYNLLAGTRDTALYYTSKPVRIIFTNLDSTVVIGGAIGLDSGKDSDASAGAAGYFDDEILVIWDNAFQVISYLQ